MKQRCTNPNYEHYHRYGGRGITFPPEWQTFEGFYKDMGDCPLGLTLGRKDNDKPYSKENCRWESCKTQSSNTSRNKTLTYNGETMTYSQWERRLGLGQATISSRIRNGWTVEEALTTGRQQRGGHYV